ncbi:MAG: hypothetical protein HC851_07155 [Acaryochloris sp. RU_4_1]|nr:hypothetical protein [Acaryochloris sp. SU_5_25]NJM65452.1 hypothetical protein [Acaryochloris sp. RU_4_1]NJR53327.1 hypothetical protein [Acaryochloris sp. CRU_2_0]
MAKSVPFERVLNNHLQDPERAMSYLKSALEEDDPQLFNAALQDVIQAQSQPLTVMPTIPKLIESLQRHGVGTEIITAIITDLHNSINAA